MLPDDLYGYHDTVEGHTKRHMPAIVTPTGSRCSVRRCRCTAVSPSSSSPNRNGTCRVRPERSSSRRGPRVRATRRGAGALGGRPPHRVDGLEQLDRIAEDHPDASWIVLIAQSSELGDRDDG